MRVSLLIVALLLSLFSISPTQAQDFNEKHYDALEYRLLGPFRGGRSAAVTGVPNQPNLFYFGSTGGGIWKTTNGGIGIFGATFKEISSKSKIAILYDGDLINCTVT